MSYDEILTEVRDFEEILLDPHTFFAHGTEDSFFENALSLLKVLFKHLTVFTQNYTLPTKKEQTLSGYHRQEQCSQSYVLLILRSLLELPTNAFTEEQWKVFTVVCISSNCLPTAHLLLFLLKEFCRNLVNLPRISEFLVQFLFISFIKKHQTFAVYFYNCNFF